MTRFARQSERTAIVTAVAAALVLGTGLSLWAADDAPELSLSLRLSPVDQQGARTLARRLRAARRGSDTHGVVRLALRRRTPDEVPAANVERPTESEATAVPAAEPQPLGPQTGERLGERLGERARHRTAKGQRSRQRAPAVDIGRRLLDDAARLSTKTRQQLQQRAGQRQDQGARQQRVRRGQEKTEGDRLHALPPDKGTGGKGKADRTGRRKGLRGQAPGQGPGPGSAGPGGMGPGPHRR